MVKPRTRRSFDGAQDLGFASDESGGELPFPFEGSTKGGGGVIGEVVLVNRQQAD